jgi:hypothetical protein
MLPYTITWSPEPSVPPPPAFSTTAPVLNEKLLSHTESTLTSDETEESNPIPNATYPPDQVTRSADPLAQNEHSTTTSTTKEIARTGFRKRKGHRKSHNGCLQCKRRKIKVFPFSFPLSPFPFPLSPFTPPRLSNLGLMNGYYLVSRKLPHVP